MDAVGVRETYNFLNHGYGQPGFKSFSREWTVGVFSTSGSDAPSDKDRV
jgi:hypothetical protein